MRLACVTALCYGLALGAILNPDPNPPPNGIEEIVDDGDDELFPWVLRAHGTGRLLKKRVRRSESLPSLWPNGTVPYVLDPSVQGPARQEIMNAVADMTRYTCVRWVERTDQADYVTFHVGGRGCHSFVGKVATGKQPISLDRRCPGKGVVIHEMLHALGFRHEQSRPDRDEHVTVHLSNIRDSKKGNFDKAQAEHVRNMDHDYDVDSVLHYAARAFSKSGALTMESKEGMSRTIRMGQRRGLSELDVVEVDKAYKAECAKRGQPAGPSVGVPVCGDLAGPVHGLQPHHTCAQLASWAEYCSDDRLLAVSPQLTAVREHCPRLCGQCS